MHLLAREAWDLAQLRIVQATRSREAMTSDGLHIDAYIYKHAQIHIHIYLYEYICIVYRYIIHMFLI